MNYAAFRGKNEYSGDKIGEKKFFANMNTCRATVHWGPEQFLESMDRTDTTDNGGGFLIDDQGSSQNRDEIDDGGDRGANVPVDQPPVGRSQRVRKPNSKYDPAIFDLDSVEVRGILLSEKNSGWKGVYWPK